MGIKINGVLISQPKEVTKTPCKWCGELVADNNHPKHESNCDLNPNIKNK